MHCEHCGTKLADGTKFCSSCGRAVNETSSEAMPSTEYFSISVGRLVLFSVLTWGIYPIYWFYRNWYAIKKAQSLNIWPVARGFFAIFFCHDLFKRVLRSAKDNGYTTSYSPQWLAAAYIVMVIVGNLWGRTASLGILDLFIMAFVLGVTPLPLIPVQRAINFNNKKIGSSQEADTKFSGGEVALIVIGILVLLLSVWGMLMPE